MMRTILATLLLALPLSARSQEAAPGEADIAAACFATFKNADKDGDGTLDGPEIAALKVVIESLQSKPRVTQDEFTSACEQQKTSTE